MNYSLSESALIKPLMESIANLGLFRQRNESLKIGILYTFYQADASKIKIGYIDKTEKLKTLLKDNSYQLLGRRNGTKRE